jgi:hypothetical protein
MKRVNAMQATQVKWGQVRLRLRCIPGRTQENKLKACSINETSIYTSETHEDRPSKEAARGVRVRGVAVMVQSSLDDDESEIGRTTSRKNSGAVAGIQDEGYKP